MSGFLETAAPVGQHTLDAFVRGSRHADAGPSSSTHQQSSDSMAALQHQNDTGTTRNDTNADQVEIENQDIINSKDSTNPEQATCSSADVDVLPTLNDWVEGTQGTPVELSLGDWHHEQDDATAPSGTASMGSAPKSAAVWECTTCTYAHNPATSPFCEVCGRMRGIAWQGTQQDEGPADDETLVQCVKCGKTVAQDDVVVHMDWHLAVELHQQEGGGRVGGGRVGGKRSRAAGGQRKIDAFLSSKPKQQRL